MKVVEATGRTVEEATQKALAEIDLPIERVKVRWLPNLVQVFWFDRFKTGSCSSDRKISPALFMCDFLEQMIARMGLTA